MGRYQNWPKIISVIWKGEGFLATSLAGTRMWAAPAVAGTQLTAVGGKSLGPKSVHEKVYVQPQSGAFPASGFSSQVSWSKAGLWLLLAPSVLIDS